MITALISDVSGDQGLSWCEALASVCDRIIVIVLGPEVGTRLPELKKLEAQAELISVDADLATVEGQARVADCIRQMGPLTFLVHNPSRSSLFTDQPPGLDSELGFIRFQIDGLLTLVRAATAGMQERGVGYVVVGPLLDGVDRAPHVAGSRAFVEAYLDSLSTMVADSGIGIVSAAAPMPSAELARWADTAKRRASAP
ncbi:hypothetical protein NOR51B_2434 [Luminiphilus syltensis NOR5-1B]|uniref:Uncharacterized protein n=1 Tax=Luminiphilus syltensis NOR5-1B TaxID=565045 RepID=B8KYA9_9GAMM|nr:hypothetical protein [Luminiphilus syltensis]EED36483.1 hypothetical protein NOR51B_2434 [Luminiphilus syltensis NOR5-1B]